jgi:hypothetical protein
VILRVHEILTLSQVALQEQWTAVDSLPRDCRGAIYGHFKTWQRQTSQLCITKLSTAKPPPIEKESEILLGDATLRSLHQWVATQTWISSRLFW